MKFTSALSAIALIVFAQTVAASPAPALGQFMKMQIIESRDGVQTREMIIFANLTHLHIDKNVMQEVGPDATQTFLELVTPEYVGSWIAASSYSNPAGE